MVPAFAGQIRIEKLQDRMQPKVPFPHKHNFYQILLITRGSGFHEIDFKAHKLARQQIFIMKPHQVHSWALDKRSDGFVVEFSAESLRPDNHKGPELHQLLLHCSDMITLSSTEEFKQLQTVCEIMRQEFLDKKENFDVCLNHYLEAFLLQVLRHAGVHTQDLKRTPLVTRFQELVERKYLQEHRVTFYAQALGVTAKALTMQTSRLLGRSPRQIIQERCLLEARRFLAYSDLSIAEIGYELGFEDPNYFTRFFRQQARITPAAFRHLSRKES